jgi:hypothetical protein
MTRVFQLVLVLAACGGEPRPAPSTPQAAADAKPAEAKPAEAKPTDTKPVAASAPAAGMRAVPASAGAADSGTTQPAPPRMAAAPSTAGAAIGIAGAPGSTRSPGYTDPGSAAWEPVPESEVASVCKLDTSKLAEADRTLGVPYAVVRYGKLCHQSGMDSPSEIWSITKGLTGVVTGIVNYQTREIPRTGPMTGQLSDWDRADHWLPASSISFNREAKVAHVLAMIGHNTDLSYGNRTYQYDAVGTVQINRLSDMMNTAIKQDTTRLGADLDAFTHRFLFEPLGMKDSTWSDGAPDKTCAYTWSTTLQDMLRMPLLLMHHGLWNGERVLDERWAYKMTHVSFEDSNRGWGYLTRLTTRAGTADSNSTTAETDACTPVATWPYYPHGASEAPDCLLADTGLCTQEYDVGMFGWQGAGGQWLAAHPGLELVLAAKNLSSGNNATVWQAVRPALVALDDKFQGDEAAFCEAYGAAKYAPDLVMPWTAPPPDDKP